MDPSDSTKYPLFRFIPSLSLPPLSHSNLEKARHSPDGATSRREILQHNPELTRYASHPTPATPLPEKVIPLKRQRSGPPRISVSDVTSCMKSGHKQGRSWPANLIQLFIPTVHTRNYIRNGSLYRTVLTINQPFREPIHLLG
ncbi:13796_t:CDS:2, partial [Acaulospora colombiana]